MLGVMPTEEALELARSQGLDVIEVQPNAQPPVVKILSFDKYRYQLEKAERLQRKKHKEIEIKGIRISVRIGQHDLEFKARQADKFLSQGHKIKVEMFLRGRERANIGYAFEVINKFLDALTSNRRVEVEPKKLGYFISAIVAPKI